MRSVLGFASLIILGLVHTASAQSSPQLLDLSPGTASSSPAKMVVMGDVAYFTATDPAHGLELWRSDGTPSGTYLVSDINPGPTGSSIDYLTVAGDRLFFSATNGASGSELFKSDGTAAGTQLVIDLIAGPTSAIPRNITAFGTGVVLSYCTYATGCELFKSDGTAAGTTLIKDILPGSTSSFPNYLTVLGNLVIFAANDGTNGEELWKSNGTAAGTVMVKNIDTTPLNYPPDGFGRSYPEGLVVMGNKVYFKAKDNSHGTEVWRTDGTTAGTVMVRDLYPGSENGYFAGLLVFDNQLFFTGRNGSAQWWTLYVTDGTSAGTVTAGPGSLERAKLNGLFIFNYVYTEPWQGDLTVAGSSQLKDIAPGESYADARGFTTAGNAVYFSANNQVNGFELWRTDGTTAGTVMVGDLNPGTASSSPSKVTQAGDYLLFTATTAANGVELWSILLNRAPDADAGADQMVGEGEPVTLDGSASSDPDSDTLTYEWRDASQAVLGDEATVTITLASGIHDITLTVSDGEYTSTDTVRVRVGNTAPMASAGGPYSSVRNTLVTFSGSGSSDVENDPLTYAWDFGDGSTATGVAPAHPYAALGTFTVTLVVNDGFADSAPLTSTVTIANQAPTAYAGGPYNGVRQVAIGFAGGGSSDPDGDGLTYAWDFGDGETGTGVAPIHAYATLGTFTVTLTVNDGHASSAPTTASVTIANRAPAANAGGPYSAVRNAVISFDGNGSSDPDADALTYAWDFGDGSTGTGAAPTHAYATVGSFTVTLVVNDGHVSSAPTTAAVTISNQAPAAHAGGPYTGVRNNAIAFTGNGSSDPDSDALTYAWDFGDGSTGTGVTPTHAYATVGSFTVTLIVNDGYVDSAMTTSTVTIANQAPAANAGGPYNGARNTAITFDGNGSSDPDADALTYAWDFGDGSTATGVAPTHGYATVGSFTVTLVVNDGTADSTPVTATVTIANQAPAASAGGPYNGVRNTSIAFNGNGSSDPDGDAVTYAWDFGDGSTATGVAPAHTYATVGTFTVTLVTNDGTADSAPATSTVTIANQAPAANAGGPYSGVRNIAIAFNSAGSSDPDGDSLSYAWNFGDGATGTGSAPSHSYTTLGVFTVTLTVNDGTTGSTPATTTVTISNLAPNANAGGPYSGTRLAAIAFNGAASSDPDGDGLTYAWNFGDGATGTGVAPSHLYTGAGTFTVTLTVSDGTTNSAPVTTTVQIANLAPTVALTAPTNNAQFAGPASITLTATAADQDGLVTQVEFFRGSTSVGVDTSSPYSVTWSGATVGTYVLTAVATDSNGAIVTSSGVTVKVTGALAPLADSYVRASQGSSNFGTETAVTVQEGNGTSNQRWTYFKFDLASLPSIANAKLRVFGAVSATTGTTIQTAVYSVANTTWTETGLTWNNKPASGTTALATVTIVNNSTTARWYELDVTAYLQAEKAAGRNTVTLALKDLANSTPYVTLSSKEATTVANRPHVLVVP